jgi:branched-chain amino acid transport system substrate-binding protein
MLKKNLIILFSLLVVSSLVFSLPGCPKKEPLFECTDPLGCLEIAPGEPIKIGILQALSGKLAPLGEAQLRGFGLALDKNKGTLLDHSIALQVEDTFCTAEGGASAALKIIADPQTVAIFGTTCSGAAATASQAMSGAGLTMISGNNSAPFLTSIAGKRAPDWQAGYFRTAGNEQYAGNTAAEYVFKQLGLRKAATINDNDIYTKGLTESFKKAFVELGGEVVLDTAVNKGETEMLPVLTAVANSGAELLFFPLFQPEGNHLLLQARQLPELEKTLLISDGALIEQSFLGAVGDAAKGMCFVGPVRPEGPAVDLLMAVYAAKYHEDPTVSYFLSAYDAAALLFHAIEQAATRDSNGTLHIGRQGIRDYLYSMKTFEGVSGTLNCDQFGDCVKPSFHILRLDKPGLGLKGLEDNVVFPDTSVK